MIEDVKLLEAIEQYLNGEISDSERAYLDHLRSTNPEVDQLFVEHSLFLQQLDRFDRVQNLRSVLSETHSRLVDSGQIEIQEPKKQGRIRYLFNRYKRTTAIAACIAGVTAVSISLLITLFSSSASVKQEDLIEMKRNLHTVDNKVNKIQDEVAENKIKVQKVEEDRPVVPIIDYNTGGTGFLIDAKGYLATNAHVLRNARNIAVQNRQGKEFAAQMVYIDSYRDIAILKITSSDFKASGLPYSIKKGSPDLAEQVYTLGFPRAEIVYGEGYVAAGTGYQGDSLALQITIAANNGNSGGPIFNKNGEVVGILSGKQRSAEGAVFALHSKYIFNAVTQLQKDTAYKSLKLPVNTSLKGLDKSQQVKKIEDCVYMVKVNSAAQ